MFSSIFGGKKWFDSLTAWGAILFAGTQAAEQSGVVAPGTSTTVVGWIELLSQLMVILGIRKAASAPNVGGGS